MSKDSGAGDFVAGFFVGTLVGGILALLFAPARGEDLRKQIQERSIELKERVDQGQIDPSEVTGSIRYKGQTFVDRQRKRWQDAVQEGKDAAAQKKAEILAEMGTVPEEEAEEQSEEQSEA